jgi:cobalamin biosynthetic protein CobC
MDSTLPEAPARTRLLHGGNRAAAEARFGRPADGWLDLSTGINPNPYPLPEIPADAWSRLPDDAFDRPARETAASYYGAPDANHVLTAPGTQALIQWLPRLRMPGRVAIVGPTYEEHGAAWTEAGHGVETIDASVIMAAAAATDVIIIVNPNNPDGRRIEPNRLMDVKDRLGRRDGLLVIDEAFADVDPALSLCNRTDEPGLVVLRSFGKFFGLAGLRLGFAIACAETIGRLGGLLGPWAVGGPALSIAATALADADWILATRRHLAEDAQRLDELLSRSGVSVIGGTDLYRLTTAPDAAGLYHHLGERGILVRPFPSQPDQLRWGLPGDEADWRRLRETMEAWA